MKLKGSSLFNIDQIQSLISRGLNYVHFSKKLEPIYREQYKNEAAYEFRFRGPIILCLYLFLCWGIYQTLPNEILMIEWLNSYIFVGIIVFIAWILSFFKPLNSWFDLYTCLGSMGAVALTIITITRTSNTENVLIHASMMYAVVIIYGFVGMRFYTALLAGWLGGLIGILFSLWSNQDISWTVLHRTYTFSSFLGMALAYAIDRQHRENYLQNCIIELNKFELTQQAQQLAMLSQIDSLTGLANRRYLTEVLEKQWRYAQRHHIPISILMIDIDCFKNYNDKLGHIAGDLCLQNVANTLRAATSRSSDLAARYGGEEFLLVFQMTNEQEIERIASYLIQQIKALNIPHPNSPVADIVTISIGTATMIPTIEDRIIEFIESADNALYHAKSQGRNRYFKAQSKVA